MKSSIVQIGNFSYYSDKVLGQGTHSTVYLGFRNQDKKPVAVKTIRTKQINTSIKKHLLDCQIAAVTVIKSPYVCAAYQVLKDGQFYFVPLQYCPNGTLRDYIKKKGKLSQNQAIQIFSKILQGYYAVKQTGFVHRDLKSENILLKSNMDPAINDFGYCQKSQTQNQRLSYNVGSPAYMSPQAYNESIYSEKSDIWALGIVLHEMLTGGLPIMRTIDVDEYFNYLKNMKTAQILQIAMNPSISKILLSCLAVDTRLRYSTQQIMVLVNPIKNSTKSNNQNRILKANSYNSQQSISIQSLSGFPRDQKNLAQSGKIYKTFTNTNMNNWGTQQSQKQLSFNQLLNSSKVASISSQSLKSSGNLGALTRNNNLQSPPLLNNRQNLVNIPKKVEQTNVNNGLSFSLNLMQIRNNYFQQSQNSYRVNQVQEPISPNIPIPNKSHINFEYSTPNKVKNTIHKLV